MSSCLPSTLNGFDRVVVGLVGVHSRQNSRAPQPEPTLGGLVTVGMSSDRLGLGRVGHWKSARNQEIVSACALRPFKPDRGIERLTSALVVAVLMTIVNQVPVDASGTAAGIVPILAALQVSVDVSFPAGSKML